VKETKVKDIKLLVMGILSPGIDTPVDFTARSRFAERPFMYESERIHGERGGQELIHKCMANQLLLLHYTFAWNYGQMLTLLCRL
jgi:hypothetical protein